MVVVLAMVAPIHRTRNKSTGVDLFVDATYLAPRYRAAPSPLPAARYRTARTEKTKRHAQALPPCAFAFPFAAARRLLRRPGARRAAATAGDSRQYAGRSDERRVGKAGAITCRSRWFLYPLTQKQPNHIPT